MKKALAAILAMLILLAGTASAEIWTLTELDVIWGEPIGVSPDGSTMLFRDHDGLFVLRNGEIKAIKPNYERGVEDTYGNFEKIVRSFDKLTYRFDSAGVVWSPDGRYFTLTYWQHLTMGQFFFDPVIFDAETGEYFLASTDGNHVTRSSASAVENACFDESGKYFDYVRFGNHVESRETLERYNLESGETTRLAELSPRLSRPGMMRLDEKRYLMISISREDTSATPGVLTLLEEKQSLFGGKNWKETTFAFSTPYGRLRTYKLLAQPDTKYALICAAGWIDPENSKNSIGLLFRINVNKNMDGIDECIYIDAPNAETASTFTVSAESNEALAERFDALYTGGVSIENAALSPDGTHALLLLRNQRKEEYSFAMLDMETLALSQIPFSDFSLYRCTPGDVSGAFAPAMQWVQDDQVLLYSGSGVRLYQIECAAD